LEGVVTVFYGLYGSGKSEIAINYGLSMAREGRRVFLVDLDAVTPYFRIRDVRQVISSRGVQVVAPKESIRYADLPVLPEGMRRILTQRSGFVVVDSGGDPTGARVLGGLRDALAPCARGLFVVNFRRPFTRDVEGAVAALDQIMGASGLMATGIVSNTHLCDQTDVSHVIDGFILCREFSERVGLPVEFVGVPLWLREREPDIRAHVGDMPILWLERLLRKPWEAEELGG
jgi:hypothetical protein